MALLNAVIDLSHHNTVTSFREAANSGILAVVHKATQGTSFVDAEYKGRRVAARGAGLLWGAYHFGINGDVEAQVKHFLDIVNPDPTDLLVLDFEPNPRQGTMTLEEAEQFVAKIHEQTKRFPGIYSDHAFIREQLRNHTDTILKNCFLWLARYAPELPQAPAPFSKVTLWHYTDGRQVRGIGRCGGDKFNGDEAELKTFWGQADT